MVSIRPISGIATAIMVSLNKHVYPELCNNQDSIHLTDLTVGATASDSVSFIRAGSAVFGHGV